ncbi:protein of unknown function (plasmid) [Pararobbsia alpina]
MERKTVAYLGSELHVVVAHDVESGFYIATQALRMTDRGGYCSVPPPSARFRSASEAFADAFTRLRKAADARFRIGENAGRRGGSRS